MKKFIVCWFFSYQKASYSTLANKWAFEQMEFLAEICLLTFREQMGIRTNGDFVWEIAKLSRKWKDFYKNLSNNRDFESKTYFSRNGKFENVANYSRTNRNSNKWDFGAEKLAQKTKMGSHLFASVLYITYDTWRLSCAITYDWHTFTYQTVLSLTHARNGDELLIILACHRRIFGTSGCSQTVFY